MGAEFGKHARDSERHEHEKAGRSVAETRATPVSDRLERSGPPYSAAFPGGFQLAQITVDRAYPARPFINIGQGFRHVAASLAFLFCKVQLQINCLLRHARSYFPIKPDDHMGARRRVGTALAYL
jgi:hypothetical protein